MFFALPPQQAEPKAALYFQVPEGKIEQIDDCFVQRISKNVVYALTAKKQYQKIMRRAEQITWILQRCEAKFYYTETPLDAEKITTFDQDIENFHIKLKGSAGASFKSSGP